VLAAADEPFSRTSVRAFDGATGALAWERIGGHEPFPLFLDRVGDGVATATEGLLLRILDPADGSAALRVPILADVYRTATADLTGDGTDDLVAAVSSGVFAFDGAALPGELRPLWKTPTQGTPRDVEIADISGDGKPEIVVPATLGVDVLRADGSIRDSIPVRSDLPDPFVWTVTVADVDGDEDLDLVVPTTSVAAFDGASGDLLWEFAPRDDQPRHFSEAVVASDGTVVLSMVPHNPRGALAARHSRSVVALDGASGLIAWLSAAPHVYAVPILWRGVELWEEDGSERVATLWNGRPDGPPVGNNVGRVDVYDVSTGELLSRAETSQMGSTHIGLERAAGQLLEYRLDGQVAYIDADTAVETGVEPSVDGALAHLGPGDERLALSFDGVTLYGKGAHSDLGGGQAEPVARWDRFITGDLTAVDLDADGTDELVAGSFDWQAFSIVASYYGTQVSGSSIGPHGLVILDPAA